MTETTLWQSGRPSAMTAVAPPAVSVLVAVRSPAPYLFEALESIRVQSTSDWELLVVLDGRPDSLVSSTLDDFADSRLRVVRRSEPAGLSAALNAGIRECRGTYVARHDADDVALPRRLELQLGRLSTNPGLGVLGGQAELISAAGRHLGVRYVPQDNARISRRLLWRNTFVHPSIIYRRELVLEVGGYDETIRRLEDWDLWLRLLGRTEMANLPDVVVRYRTHEAQHSRERRFAPAELSALSVSRRAAAERLGHSALSTHIQNASWIAYQRARHAATSHTPRRRR